MCDVSLQLLVVPGAPHGAQGQGAAGMWLSGLESGSSGWPRGRHGAAAWPEGL